MCFLGSISFHLSNVKSFTKCHLNNYFQLFFCWAIDILDYTLICTTGIGWYNAIFQKFTCFFFQSYPNPYLSKNKTNTN